MKKLVLTAVMLAAAGAAYATTTPSDSTVFTCKAPSFGFTTSNFSYCTGNIVSGTTSTAIGGVNIDPTKSVSIIHRGSTAVSPTFNFFLDGTPVYALTVSTSTTPQGVNLGLPFFNNVTVSMSNPASLTSVNAVSVTIVENK